MNQKQEETDEISIEALKSQIKNDKERKIILLLIFTTCFAGFIVLVSFSPHLKENEKEIFYQFPRTIQQFRELNDIIQRYSVENHAFVFFAFIYLYVFLQSFAIPGPIVLSILSGQLFGAPLGFSLVCLCATLGASCCYGLSYSLARGLVLDKFPSAIVMFNRKVREKKDNLLFYMLFLRFTPLIPNVSVNVAAPIVGLPFKYFFFGTLFGLMPANIIHLRTGLALKELTDMSTSYQAILTLLSLSILALLPTFFKKKLQQFDEKRNKKKE